MKQDGTFYVATEISTTCSRTIRPVPFQERQPGLDECSRAPPLAHRPARQLARRPPETHPDGLSTQIRLFCRLIAMYKEPT